MSHIESSNRRTSGTSGGTLVHFLKSKSLSYMFPGKADKSFVLRMLQRGNLPLDLSLMGQYLKTRGYEPTEDEVKNLSLFVSTMHGGVSSEYSQYLETVLNGMHIKTAPARIRVAKVGQRQTSAYYDRAAVKRSQGGTSSRPGLHSGTDHSCVDDPNLKAGLSGQVTRVGRSYGSGYGNVVSITTQIFFQGKKYPIEVTNAHLKRTDLKVGQFVTPDQSIGVCGNTGGNYDVHRHLMVTMELSDIEKILGEDLILYPRKPGYGLKVVGAQTGHHYFNTEKQIDGKYTVPITHKDRQVFMDLKGILSFVYDGAKYSLYPNGQVEKIQPEAEKKPNSRT